MKMDKVANSGISRIDEIKQRLENSIEENGLCTDTINIIWWLDRDGYTSTLAILAAHAQTDIKFLLDEVERLQWEVNSLKANENGILLKDGLISAT